MMLSAADGGEKQSLLKLLTDEAGILFGRDVHNPKCVVRSRAANDDEQGSSDHAWVLESNCPILTPQSHALRRGLHDDGPRDTIEGPALQEMERLKQRVHDLEEQVRRLVEKDAARDRDRSEAAP